LSPSGAPERALNGVYVRLAESALREGGWDVSGAVYGLLDAGSKPTAATSARPGTDSKVLPAACSAFVFEDRLLGWVLSRALPTSAYTASSDVRMRCVEGATPSAAAELEAAAARELELAAGEQAQWAALLPPRAERGARAELLSVAEKERRERIERGEEEPHQEGEEGEEDDEEGELTLPRTLSSTGAAADEPAAELIPWGGSNHEALVLNNKQKHVSLLSLSAKLMVKVIMTIEEVTATCRSHSAPQTDPSPDGEGHAPGAALLPRGRTSAWRRDRRLALDAQQARHQDLERHHRRVPLGALGRGADGRWLRHYGRRVAQGTVM